jgi:hypothetical protein
MTIQSCGRGGRRIVEDMCYEIRRVVSRGVCVYYGCVCVYYCRTFYKAVCGGGGGTVKDMYYEVRRAEACVDYFAHHALVNARERDIV